MTSRVDADGTAEIMGHEGCVLYRFLDSVGVNTIFIGHTAAAGPPDPSKRPFGKEYPMEEAIEVFRRDVRKFEDRVNKAVKVPVSQTEFNALVSFDLNSGGIFKANLTKTLNAGGSRSKVASQFMGWSKPPEIIPRRRAESILFRSGEYSNKGMATVYPADGRGKVLWGKGKRFDARAAAALIFDANVEDRKAEVNAKSVVTSGGAAVVSGSGAQTLPLGGDLRLVLIAALVVFETIAAVFVAGYLVGRSKAKRKNAEAAAAVMKSIKDGELL